MAVYYLKERYMSRQLQQLLAECQKQFPIVKTKTRACRQASSSCFYLCFQVAASLPLTNPKEVIAITNEVPP